jgi:hypothetical protein
LTVFQAVGLYPTNSSSVNKFILQDCCANILIVEEEKGVNKILSMKKDLPDLKKIVQVISRPKCMFLESPKIVDIY